MTRFAEVLETMKPQPVKRAGLDNFAGDRCGLCGVSFDPKDAKIWTRETGKVPFRCYVKWKKEQQK